MCAGDRGLGGGLVETKTRRKTCTRTRTVDQRPQRVHDCSYDCKAGISPASTTTSRFCRKMLTKHPPPITPSPTTTIPTQCTLLGSMHTYTRHLCSTPSPWGGGPSNTDVALINWVQHREVGLETTWQFPAASLPPLPSPLLNPSLLLVFGSRKSAGGLLGGVSAVWR